MGPNIPSLLRDFAVMLGCLCAVLILGIVRVDYPRAVENDPLNSPIRIETVNGDELTLADDRVFRVDSFDNSLADVVKTSDGRVDVDLIGDGRQAEIYGKHRGWICGTPWIGLINVPLIPVDIPINQRKLLGYGELIPLKDDATETDRSK